MLSKTCLQFKDFFSLHPVFFFLLFIIAGISASYKLYLPLVFVIPFIYAQNRANFRFVAIAILIFSFIYTDSIKPPLMKGFVPVKGTLAVQQIQKKIKNHKPVFRLVSQARLHTKQAKTFNIKVVHYISNLATYNEKQIVRGKICQLNNTYFFIQDKSNIQQNKKERTNRVIQNFKKKQAIIKKIKKHTKSVLSQDLFCHLLLALNPVDTFVYDLFSNFGLTHILVISGFHFSLLLLVLSLFLTPFIKKKWLTIALILGSIAFFLFIGKTASMLRAFICLNFFLTANLFNLHIKSLNGFSLAAIVSIVLNPPILFDVGFQLTFLATFAILVGYKPIKCALEKVLKKRSLEQFKNLSLLEKHLYLIKQVLLKIVALNVAVQLLTMATLLYHFQIIPLNSLVYNIFIPPMIILILAPLFTALIAYPCAPISLKQLSPLVKKCLSCFILLQQSYYQPLVSSKYHGNQPFY